MKSVKVKELMKWLEDGTNVANLPREYSLKETLFLVEIAELELEGSDKLDEKVEEFKKMYELTLD
jgi:hypothetical protein